MEKVISLFTGNIEAIVGFIIVLIPLLVKVYKQWKSNKSLSLIVKTMIDFADKTFADEPEEEAREKKKDLRAAHELLGTQLEVEKKMSEIKKDRDRNSGLEVGLDIDEDMNWKAGAKWRLPFGR